MPVDPRFSRLYGNAMAYLTTFNMRPITGWGVLRHMHVGKYSFLWLLTVVAVGADGQFHTSRDRWKEPRLYHCLFDEEFAYVFPFELVTHGPRLSDCTGDLEDRQVHGNDNDPDNQTHDNHDGRFD